MAKISTKLNRVLVHMLCHTSMVVGGVIYISWTKLKIMGEDPELLLLLNKRMEIVSKCCHKNKFMLLLSYIVSLHMLPWPNLYTL